MFLVSFPICMLNNSIRKPQGRSSCDGGTDKRRSRDSMVLGNDSSVYAVLWN